MKKRLFRRSYLPLLFAVFLLFLFFLTLDTAVAGARSALYLLATRVAPALFPFLVVSEWLNSFGAQNLVGRICALPAEKIFGLGERGGAALFFGVLCGFPVGILTALAARHEAKLSRGEFCRLSLFCDTPSAGFLVGAVGVGVFGNKSAGTALFLSVVSASLLVGFFSRFFFSRTAPPMRVSGETLPKASFFPLLTGGVTRALSSLLTIAAFVLFFSALSSSLAALGTAFRVPPTATLILSGLLEFSGGIFSAARLLSPERAFLVSSFFAAFGGFSLAAQLFALSGKERPPLSAYFAAHLIKGALAACFSALYLRFAKPLLASPADAATSALSEQNAADAGTAFLLLFLFALFFFSRKRRKRT